MLVHGAEIRTLGSDAQQGVLYHSDFGTGFPQGHPQGRNPGHIHARIARKDREFETLQLFVKFGNYLLFFLSIQSSTSFQTYSPVTACRRSTGVKQSKVPKPQVTGKKTMTTN
jgi:hypothetical protein